MKLSRKLCNFIACGAVALSLLGMMFVSVDEAQAQIVLKQTRTNLGNGITDRDRERMRQSDRRIQQRTAERQALQRRAWEANQRSLQNHWRNRSPMIGGGGSGRRTTVSRGVTR